MFGQVYDSIREGESIAKPMKDNSYVLKNAGAMPALVFMAIMSSPSACYRHDRRRVRRFRLEVRHDRLVRGSCMILGAVVAALITAMLAYRLRNPVLDDMVVNMVDVGEETGELDTMLYKVADTFDEEVAVLTESLTALMEPLLIITLGGIVGFIVIALFMPLISLISNLSGGK